MIALPKNIRSDAELGRLLEQLEQQAEAEIQTTLQQLGTGTTKATKEAMTEFIDRIAARRQALNVKPEFTPEIVSTCTQILAFGVAALAAIVAFSEQLAQLPVVWRNLAIVATGAAANLTLVALIVLVWFFIQARTRYPFLFLKRLGNAEPFFYYQTLDRRTSFRPFGSRNWIAKANDFYLKDLVSFGKTLLAEHKDPVLRARHELQQYYLLIVYQGYLDQYEMQLEHTFLIGIFYTIAATIAVALAVF